MKTQKADINTPTISRNDCDPYVCPTCGAFGLQWQKSAIETEERQLQAFQEMQAISQRKETQKRHLVSILKGICPLLPEDVKEKIETEIVKAETP